MEIKLVTNNTELNRFFHVPETVYQGNRYHRKTEDSIVRLVVKGPTVFTTHATIKPCIITNNGSDAGRFAFIYDTNLSDTVQVAFFEVIDGLQGVSEAVKNHASKLFPGATKLVVGLNGHLNYGAGILLNRFDEVPLFGLSYTQPYYPSYFSDMYCRQTLTYRFDLEPFRKWEPPVRDTQGITVRFMNKKRFREEIELYTYIDNTSFTNTEYWYWSNRLPLENYELFHPFKPLIDSENLIFAEKYGKPIGFILWYPDFNMLPGADRDLNFYDLLRFRLNNPITTIRFTEVALLPEYRKSPAVALMIKKMAEKVTKAGYTTCEGGFIFEQNMNSRVMTKRILERVCGASVEPYRRYGIFESSL